MDVPARPLLQPDFQLYIAVIQTKSNLMDWPALSLDMSPIQKVWRKLARDVYAKRY